RAEALTECQTLRELRDATEGEERAELERRIRAALPSVVSEIWVQPQKVSQRHQIVHIQIYLRSGQSRCPQLLPRNLHGSAPWQVDGWDLRRGPFIPARHESHATALPETA